MKQFKNAKVDDQVWSIKYGWGIITNINNGSIDYPITVKYPTKSTTVYTLDGKWNSDDIHPEIYWDVVTFEYPKQPKRLVKKEFIGYTNILPSNTLNANLIFNNNYKHGSIFLDIKKVPKCYGSLGIAKVTFEFEVEE